MLFLTNYKLGILVIKKTLFYDDISTSTFIAMRAQTLNLYHQHFCVHQLFVYLLAEMSKKFSEFSILKTSKIEEFGVKKFQKITFGSNFTLKK